MSSSWHWPLPAHRPGHTDLRDGRGWIVDCVGSTNTVAFGKSKRRAYLGLAAAFVPGVLCYSWLTGDSLWKGILAVAGSVLGVALGIEVGAKIAGR